MLRVEGVALGGAAPLTFEIAESRAVGVLSRDVPALLRFAECTAGLRAPLGGRILIDDVDIHREPDRARPLISINLARAAHPHSTIAEHLATVAASRSTSSTVADALSRLGLNARARLDTKPAQSAAALAAALMTGARVVVLHDAFRDLDEGTRTKAIQWIRTLSSACVLVTGDTERDVRSISHSVLEPGDRR